MPNRPFSSLIEQSLKRPATPRDAALSETAYLLLDGARLPNLVDWLATLPASHAWVGLYGGAIDSPLLAVSPVLTRLLPGDGEASLYQYLQLKNRQRTFSVVLSRRSLGELAEHLQEYLYVAEDDGTTWGLAFWDPPILAALTGSPVAADELVPGPILTSAQSASLLSAIDGWCFLGRDGAPAAIRPPEFSGTPASPPFELNSRQMTQLADLTLPDQVLNALHEIAAQQVRARSYAALYKICCTAIALNRQHGADTLAAHCTRALSLLGTATG